MGLLSNYNKSTGGAYSPFNKPTAMTKFNSGISSYSPSAAQPQNYVVPSRIAPVNVLDQWTGHAAGFIGEAMTIPAKVVETPFAFLNQGIKALSSAIMGGPGVDVASAIGKTPIGDVFKSAGDFVDRVGNFVPALINSTDTALIYKYRNESDDFVIPDFGEVTEGPPILGMFGIGRQKTLGELKAELRARGFGDQDFADIRNGRRSVFDYGDRMTNENLLVGLGTRVALDPTNLLFLVPGAATAKLGYMASRAGNMINGLATTARRGDAAFDLAVKSGTRPSPVPSAAVLAREMRHGRATGVLPGIRTYADDMVRTFNQRGYDFRNLGKLTGVAQAGVATGKFFLDPKGYSTRTGFYKRAAALYGAELAITALPDGMLDGMQSFAQESLDRRPLSQNTAFMLAAAFTVPFREMTQMMPEYWNASMTKTFDNTLAPELEKTFGMSVDELARSVGGRPALEKIIFAHAVNVLRNTTDDLDSRLKAAIESMNERGDTAITISRNVYVLTEAALRTGKIRGSDIVEQLKTDFKNASALRGETITMPDGTEVVLEDLAAQLPFDPHNWIERTRNYVRALKVVEEGTKGNPGGLRDKVTIGLRTSYTKEQMDPLIATIKGLDQDGSIPLSDIRSFLVANQILFRMWNREKYAMYLGDYPRDTVNTKTFITLLEQTRQHRGTPTNADYYWKDEEYQRESIFQQPDGPMQNKLQSLANKISATIDPNTGMVKRGKRKQYDAYREKLRREVAWRVGYGDEIGSASPKVVAQSLRAEILRVEDQLANIGLVNAQGGPNGGWRQLIDEMDPPADGMIRVYRGEGGFSKSEPGGRWFSASEVEAWGYSASDRRLKYVDITPEEAAKFRSGNGDDPSVFEFRLSDEVAARQKPVGRDDKNLWGILDDLREAERYFGVRARGSSGAKSWPTYVKALDEINDITYPIPKLDDAIIKHIPEWYRDEMEQLTNDVWELGPEYTVTLAPKDSYMARPSDRLPEAMLKQRNLVARVMYDHNVFGAPARFMDFLLRPVGSSKMLADAEQAIMNEYIGVGAKPEQVRTFLARLREEAIEKHSINPKFGYRMYGSVKAVLPQTVNKIAADVFGGADSPVQIKIGPENHHRVIDRASSRLLRDLRERNSQRKQTGKLSSLVNDRFWQDFERDLYVFRSGGVTRAGSEIPGLTSVLGTGRLLSNTLYHLFRFMMDARWHLMNRFEHVIIGSVRDGLSSSTGPLSPRFRRASGMSEGFKSDPADLVAGTMGGTKPSYLVDAAETGMFHGNRAVAARIAKTFDSESPGSIEAVLNDMQFSDPALVKLRRDFGVGDNRQLAEILDEQWFNFDRQGVGKTVRQEYLEMFRDEPKTAQTMAEQSLIIQRLSKVNRDLYDDLVKTYLGNPDRNTLERIANSYWLFWPLSYQIKASKWLVRAMTMQAFGRDTNALGLFQYAQLKEYFADQLMNNEGFAEEWSGQEHLWKTAAMFFPITPEDVGVSLSRPVRTFGSMFFPDWFEPTFGTRDPISGLAYTFEIGPLYTVRLLRSMGATIFPEGADVSIIEPQIPDLDMEVFASQFPVTIETIQQ